jgi:hypothetical protein
VEELFGQRRICHILPVVAAGLYVLCYLVFLRDIPGTYYDFRFASLLELVALPILLFALGDFLGAKFQSSGGADSSDANKQVRARKKAIVKKTIISVIAISYILLALLMFGTNSSNSTNQSVFLGCALVFIHYLIMYGGVVAGFVYGFFS